MAKIEVPDELIPDNGELAEAYLTKTEIIVIGEPYRQQEHNCDGMGCTTFSHVIYRQEHGLLSVEAAALAMEAD